MTLWSAALTNGNMESMLKNVSSVELSQAAYFINSAAIKSPEIIETNETVARAGSVSGGRLEIFSSSLKTLHILTPTFADRIARFSSVACFTCSELSRERRRPLLS